jgi:hypothetical protein
LRHSLWPWGATPALAPQHQRRPQAPPRRPNQFSSHPRPANPAPPQHHHRQDSAPRPPLSSSARLTAVQQPQSASPPSPQQLPPSSPGHSRRRSTTRRPTWRRPQHLCSRASLTRPAPLQRQPQQSLHHRLTTSSSQAAAMQPTNWGPHLQCSISFPVMCSSRGHQWRHPAYQRVGSACSAQATPLIVTLMRGGRQTTCSHLTSSSAC